MKHAVLAALLIWSPPALAQDVGMAGLSVETTRAITPVVRAANRAFTRMPQVQLTSRIADLCGGDDDSDRLVRYCTTDNIIYVARDLVALAGSDAAAAYYLAHAYGHAIQVRHGVADAALARIAAAPAREAELRAMVEGQVECLAGILHRRALGLGRTSPRDWTVDEPFTTSHWGATPIAAGPRVSIGLAARDDWFRTGRNSDDVAVCAVGEIDAGPIVRAERP